jgi:nucleotide-binding universal stress UspA family protein
MKNILLPTDFSENSVNAIHYALELFEGEPCNFFILNTQSPASYISDDLVFAGNQSLYDTIVKSTKEKLSFLLVDLKNEFKTSTFNFELLVDYDALPEAINQIKTSKKIDLIVMGTNGATGAKEVVFGSNTINVIRKVDCPTLIIPEDFKYRAPKEILLPLDLSDSLDSKAFLKVIKFMKRFSEKLHVVRIKPQDEDSKEEEKDKENIGTFLKDIQHEYHTVSNIPISATVDCYIQTHQIDLITLLVQVESLIERLFIGSPTSRINSALRVPLLVFHS